VSESKPIAALSRLDNVLGPGGAQTGNSEWGVHCSGTFVAPDVIVTAAHCVVQNAEETGFGAVNAQGDIAEIKQDLTPLKNYRLRVCVAAASTNGGLDCDWKTAAHVYPNPMYAGKPDIADDWAVVVLSQAAGSNRRADASIATTLPSDWPTTSGFRMESAQRNGSFQIDKIEPSTGNFAISSGDISSPIFVLSNGDQHVEGGDSGSGVYFPPGVGGFNSTRDLIGNLSSGSPANAYFVNHFFWRSTLRAYVALKSKDAVLCVPSTGWAIDDLDPTVRTPNPPQFTLCLSSQGSSASLDIFDDNGARIEGGPSTVPVAAIAVGALRSIAVTAVTAFDPAAVYCPPEIKTLAQRIWGDGLSRRHGASRRG